VLEAEAVVFNQLLQISQVDRTGLAGESQIASPALLL
jgi:hypothetical protein